MRTLFLGITLLFLGLPALGQQAPAVRPAVDAIFEAFQTHPLVGLGETHRRAQEIDFYTALIRDARFPREVGNVVVEFGGAAHQDIIDRYVAGADVPYLELRKVWTDTVGWLPVVPSSGYQEFYAQVREINLTLPPQSRIHVWLGEPAIDWSHVKTHEDWEELDRKRDSYPAEVIEREILARGKKSLIVYGGGHFALPVPGALGERLTAADWQRTTLKALIDRDHPGALYTATFYTGSGDKSCIGDFEHNTTTAWPIPSLVVPFRGSAIADTLQRCNPMQINDVKFPIGFSDSEKQQSVAFYEAQGVGSDALIYVGPRASLTFAPYISDIYLDTDYYREIARRWEIQTAQTHSPPKIATNPMSPQFANH